jgi:hypothetical protein
MLFDDDLLRESAYNFKDSEINKSIHTCICFEEAKQ